jgi:hypothetical protein
MRGEDEGGGNKKAEVVPPLLRHFSLAFLGIENIWKI